LQGAAGVAGPPVVLLLPGLQPNTSNAIASLAELPTIAPIDICTMVSWWLQMYLLFAAY
jgi:hypothetical protein